MATIDDFRKLDLRIAQIKEVKIHPNADKLYVLKVECGSEERQLVAGIRKSYAAEELVGKRVVLVANLEPAVIRGETSQGMILAAADENGPILVSPEKPAALGSQVK